MVNDIKRGPLANALVLHEFKRNPIDLKGWFYFVEQWLKQGNIKPTKIDITGKNGVKGRSTIKFEKGKKHLESCKFVGLDGVWIGALPPYVGTEMADFIVAVHLDVTPLRGTLVLCWDDQIIMFDKGYLETLAKDLYLYLEPTYGYGYQRNFRYNPSFYPFGMTGGTTPRGEEGKIEKWQIEYFNDGSYKTGILRDIYPTNFLTEPHLIQKLGNQTLRSWIESTDNHGKLHPLNDQLWAWHVPDERIPSIREELRNTRILLCI